jgi:hypothetical protein
MSNSTGNVTQSLPLPPIYYHAREMSYWRMDGRGRWMRINDTSARSYIADQAYSKAPLTPGANSEVEKCIMEVQANQNVAYVGPLAGYSAGVYRMGEHNILVTDSPKFIAPNPGEWRNLETLFRGMFVDGDLDQRPYFYGWIKNALDSFCQRRWKASQLLALAGAAKSGKSLTQNLLTAMFGGRCAKPYQFMMGQTQFNSHMFGAEHLMLEDEAESVDIRSRRHFAANIKTILAGRDQNCHAKNREALILQPIWRMSLSLNDDPERLLVLPPFDTDVKDKIIALKVSKVPMPMPTGTVETDSAFWEQLVSELPAFLNFIDHYQVPAHLQDSRYGILAYQHPEIVERIQETTPEMKLLELIDQALWYGHVCPETWEGTAGNLERELTDDNSQVSYEARRLLNWNQATGTYLARLRDSVAEHARGRVQSRTLHGRTIWKIEPVEIPAAVPRPPLAPVPNPTTAQESPPALPEALRTR